MKITDIKVRKLFQDAGPMRAVVSVTFDGQLALHDIKVINAKNRLFIVMPSRKNPDGIRKVAGEAELPAEDIELLCALPGL